MMATYPRNLQYTREHEWARIEDDVIRVGITAYAVEQLGDVTLVDMPAPGEDVQAHERFGDIEGIAEGPADLAENHDGYLYDRRRGR